MIEIIILTLYFIGIIIGLIGTILHDSDIGWGKWIIIPLCPIFNLLLGIMSIILYLEKGEPKMEQKTALVFDWPPRLVKLNKEKVEPTECVKELQQKLESVLDDMFQEVIKVYSLQLEKNISEGKVSVCYTINARIVERVKKYFSDKGFKTKIQFGNYLTVSLPEKDDFKYSTS